MFVLGAVLFGTGVIVIMVTGLCLLFKNDDNDDKEVGLLIVVALYSSLIGVGIVTSCRKGVLNQGNLKTNAIYETVVAKEDSGKVVAILREQDGELRAYELKKLPPPVFKAVKDKDNPYQPYPPAK